MIIEKSAIKMRSGHQEQQVARRTEVLRHKSREDEPGRSRTQAAPQRPPIDQDRIQLSQAAKAAGTGKCCLDLQQQPEAIHSLTMEIIRRMFKEMTGLDLQLFSPDQLQAQAEQIDIQQPPPPASAGASQDLIYQQSISYFESETTSFDTEGSITTKDGKSIAFSLSMSMSRSFYTETTMTLSQDEAPKKDPLVINFSGDAAELSNTHFAFDIDADGSLDQIAAFKSDSGLLAWDKNQDGQINDGTELFGAKTGNGFAELAAYDEDGNRFIDEGDSIYRQLRVWQRHEDGSQQLVALGDKNIGAIYLGHVSTPFQLKAEDDNRSLGEVASSGIYLTEQGRVGTVQQINFTV